MIWQVLDVRAVWIKEFASALSRQVSTLGWLPNFSRTGILQNQEAEFSCQDPRLLIRSFPLQRGFARFPLNRLLNESTRIANRLAQRSGAGAKGPVVFTTPHYAPVAEQWPGPAIYYVTDLFAAYGKEPQVITVLDRTMCDAAALVCPNSQRIADYLKQTARCPDDKIVIVPNATRATNLFETAPQDTGELPVEFADLQRPVAGVIGNLAGNTDWILLRQTIEKTPWLSWLFVGPTDMVIAEPDQRSARDCLMRQGGRVRFAGARPYGDLQSYARAFDVAILPYRKIEPTYSGSSTRFYEHLAACRPMVATRGFEELLHREPLLQLVNDSEQMAAALEQLRQRDFRDGLEKARWQASLDGTWEQRAAQMIAALAERVRPGRVVAA